MKVAHKSKKKQTNITEEELKELQTHMGTLGNIISQVGEIEVRKAYAVMAHQEGERKLNDCRTRLKAKYGDVVINPRTGEISDGEDKKD